MWKLLPSTAIILALSSPVWAQSEQTGNEMTLEQGNEATGFDDQVDHSNYPFLDDMNEGAWSSETLIGQDLMTTDGEVIGEIDGVLFTPDDRIAGIIVDPAEDMGAESGPVVVDWYAVNVSPEDQMLTADLSQEQLQSAPQQDEEGFVELWRNDKVSEVPDVAESQPGVVTGEDVEKSEEAPDAGAGSNQ